MSGIVGGINITDWATASNHEKTVTSVYNKIKEQLDGIKGSNRGMMESMIDNIIQSNSIVKKQGGSPVTAKMIMDYSERDKIDPALVMAIAHVDSHYGTMGKGKRTRNPGNWGNDDTGKLVTFNTWDEGISALTKQLKRWKERQGASDYISNPQPYDPQPDLTQSIITQARTKKVPETQKVSQPSVQELTSKKQEIKGKPIDVNYISPVDNFFNNLTTPVFKTKEKSKTIKQLESKITKSGFVTSKIVEKKQSGGNIGTEFIPDTTARQDTRTSTNPILFKDKISMEDIDESANILKRRREELDVDVESKIKSRPALAPILDYIAPPKETSESRSTIPGLDNVAALQKHILSKNESVGSTGADGKLGTNTIKGLQRVLMKEGYDIGQKQGFKDDGILGSRTKTALQKYREDNSPGNSEEENSEEGTIREYKSGMGTGFLGKCDEGHCSEFVQQEVSRNLKIPLRELQESAGLRGDAWQLIANARKKGAKLLYSTSDEINRTEHVKPGDIVSLYTSGSSNYQSDADSEGGSSIPRATHVGIIDSTVQSNSKGKYVYVLHNVHRGTGLDNKGKQTYQGRKYRSKLYLSGEPKMKDDFGFVARNIVSPNYSGSQGVSADPNIKIQSENKGKVANKVVETLNDLEIKKKLMFDLGVTEQEYYDLSQAALGIMDQESKFGKVNKVPLIPGKFELFGKELGAKLYRKIKGDETETSLGYGRIKFDTNFTDSQKERLSKEYGVDKSNISVGVDSGRNSTIATMFALGDRFNKLKLDKSLSPQDRMYLAIQKYNRYNLKSPYGSEQKSSIEYAEDKDLSYVNKVLNYGDSFKVTKNNEQLNTVVEDLSTNWDVIKKQLMLFDKEKYKNM